MRKSCVENMRKSNPKRVLMCGPPVHFFPGGKINYEINPLMTEGEPIDTNLAVSQWLTARLALKNIGIKVYTIPQAAGFSDMVFPANAALVKENKVLLSNYNPLARKKRQGEIPYFKAWFEAHKYQCYALPKNTRKDAYFEGESNALWCDDNMLACGYGAGRANEYGARLACDFFECKPALLKITHNKLYDLDTCFAYPKKNLVIAYLGAFDDASICEMEKLGDIEPVPEYDTFGCNMISDGRNLIMPKVSRRLKTILEDKHGFNVYEFNFSELMKSGGAAKCTALFI